MSLATEFAQNDTDQVSNSDVDQSVALNHNSFEVGDFVGLVQSDSSLNEPKVSVAQIQSFHPNNQASLLGYTNTGRKGQYVFQFENKPWLESLDALHPIDMRPMKKRKGTFKLYTSPEKIHKAFT